MLTRKRRERETVQLKCEIVISGLHQLPPKVEGKCLQVYWSYGNKKTGARGELPMATVQKGSSMWPREIYHSANPLITLSTSLWRYKDESKFRAANTLKFVCTEVVGKKIMTLYTAKLFLEEHAEDGLCITEKVYLKAKKKNYATTKPYMELNFSTEWLAVNKKAMERQPSMVVRKSECTESLSLIHSTDEEATVRESSSISAEEFLTLQNKFAKLQKKYIKHKKKLETVKKKYAKKKEKIRNLSVELEEQQHDNDIQGAKIDSLQIELVELKRQLAEKEKLVKTKRIRFSDGNDQRSVNMEEAMNMHSELSDLSDSNKEIETRNSGSSQMQGNKVEVIEEKTANKQKRKIALCTKTEKGKTSAKRPISKEFVVNEPALPTAVVNEAITTHCTNCTATKFIDTFTVPPASYPYPHSQTKILGPPPPKGGTTRAGIVWLVLALMLGLLMIGLGLYNGGVPALNQCLLCWGVGVFHCATYFFVTRSLHP